MTKRKVKWNHEADSFFDAVGVTKEEVDAAVEKHNDLTRKLEESGTRKSQSRYVQMLVENFDPVMMYILGKYVHDQKIDQIKARILLKGLLSDF